MAQQQPKIVIVGAGVIGGSVGGWIAPHYDKLYLLDQGETAAALKARGLSLYPGDHPEAREQIPVKVLDDMEQVADADIVVLGVKNYSLEPVARRVSEVTGGRAVLVSMANGILNQRVLPDLFAKVIYCVVSYNAWMDEPGVIGFQKKGPLIIGTPDNSLQAEMQQLAEIFNRGVETVVTPHLQDAVHCKIVINLTNSVTTLVGHRFQEISDPALFQRILTSLLYEGKQIVQAAGYRECKLGGMPSWKLLWVGAKLPQAITRPMFQKNVSKMMLSSMAQDVLKRGGKENELETINGYMVELADQCGLRAPVNRTIYELCRREFAKPDFTPLDVREVWASIEQAR